MSDEPPSLFDPPDDNLRGKVGRDHPETSSAAADLCRPSFGSQRAAALQIVASAGSRGATAAEVAERMSMSRNQIATRLLELREQGWISYVPLEVVGHDGSVAYLTRATGPSTSGRVHVLADDAGDAYVAWIRDERARRSSGE